MSFQGRNRGGPGGGGRGGRGRGAGGDRAERPKKEAILDLAKYNDQQIRVKFAGGREVLGTLKGYDQLMNLVLDEVKEFIKDEDGHVTNKMRDLGLVVARGPLLLLISPEGEEIANPFLQQDDPQE